MPSLLRRPALRAIVDTRAGRWLVGVVAAVAVLTVVGLVALWPSGSGPTVGGVPPTVGGTVVDVRSAPCGGPTEQQCRTAVVRIDDGPDRGTDVDVLLGPAEVSPDLRADQGVRLVDQSPAPGTPVADAAPDAAPTYAFSSVDRRAPLILLALLFGLLGAFVARGRGVLALLGTALSLSLVVLWLVPAILDGHPPLLVATVGALAVMFVTTVLTYGSPPRASPRSPGSASRCSSRACSACSGRGSRAWTARRATSARSRCRPAGSCRSAASCSRAW